MFGNNLSETYSIQLWRSYLQVKFTLYSGEVNLSQLTVFLTFPSHENRAISAELTSRILANSRLLVNPMYTLLRSDWFEVTY